MTTALRAMFLTLRYPKVILDSTIHMLSHEDRIEQTTSQYLTVYLKLPLKDQRSADKARIEIHSLGSNIDVKMQPVLVSKKLSQTLSVKGLVQTKHPCLVLGHGH